MPQGDPPAPLVDEVAARPWSEVSKTYRDLVLVDGWTHLRPLMVLVERLSTSRYAAGLFGATSHEDLLIAQTETFRWDRELLRISCDGAELTFSFVEGPTAAPWRRRYPEDQGFSALEHFLVERKRWFRPER